MQSFVPERRGGICRPISACCGTAYFDDFPVGANWDLDPVASYVFS